MDKLTGKKIIIFGAGIAGKNALFYFGSRSVKCFVDNNKAGDFYYGKHVISFDELKRIHNDYDLVVSVGRWYSLAITKQLEEAGITDFAFFESLHSIDDFESNPEIEKYRNTHAGEKCFIVANGPSLRASDLEVLHKNNIFSFGYNRIYKIYDQTNWRPDIYMMGDPSMITVDLETVLRLDAKLKILAHPRYTKHGEEYKLPSYTRNRVLFYSHIPTPWRDVMSSGLPFSNDLSKCAFAGAGGSLVMIQWAAYMGFTEIYLLGADGHYSVNHTKSVENKDTDHFTANYNDNNLIEHYKIISYEPEFLNTVIAVCHESFEAYSRKHGGFRIYNATRGGKLEAFERVDFDSLF